MARTCDICGRGTTRDASRSHSNIRTLKKQFVNLQSRKVGGKTQKVCANCIKTLKRKEAAVAASMSAKKKTAKKKTAKTAKKKNR
jgi:ribosomal protein L28